MRISHLDHLVLTVASIEATCRFYSEVLGMRVVTFGEGRTALCFGNQKLNLHQAGRELEPRAAHPKPGSADLCFIVEGSLEALRAYLQSLGVAMLDEAPQRSGAMGPIQSVYLRDPDGNLIELSIYPDTPE